MDVTNLILYLKSKITSKSIDQQMVSKALRLLELGAVFTADSFSALPSAVGRSGELWYVLYDGLYWSTGELWWPIVQTNYGLIWTWGSNSAGQLADNTTTNRSSPVSVVGGYSDWCDVSAGNDHSAAIRTGGSAWSWGCNTNGRLGDNTITSRSSPVSVVGGFTDWCHISAGDCHTVAVRTNGSAWAWGLNSVGHLGDSTTTSRSSPVSVVGGFTDWCDISAGGAHSVAIRTNGSAWAWGQNTFGPLGDNAATNKSSPVSVVGGFTDWCDISAGVGLTVAVRTGGSAWAWGIGTSGQMGDNSSANRSSPVSVVGGFDNWCQVSGAASHVTAIRSNGSAWAWGSNFRGILGDNTAVAARSSPVSVVGGFTNWCQIGAGCVHTVAVRTSGSAWAWGYNNCGQLGDCTVTIRSSPVSVVGGFDDWCKASSGYRVSVAIRSKTL